MIRKSSGLALFLGMVLTQLAVADHKHDRIARHADDVVKAANRLERRVGKTDGYRHLENDVHRVEQSAQEIESGAKANEPHHRLQRKYDRFDNQWDRLRADFRRAHETKKDGDIGQRWEKLTQEVRELARAFKHHHGMND
jgi:hypothetical protein